MFLILELDLHLQQRDIYAHVQNLNNLPRLEAEGSDENPDRATN